MGATFKENVSDIRNSKVIDVINELISFGVEVDVIDPHASTQELAHEYGHGLTEKPNGKYHAVILAVNHDEYLNKPESYFADLLEDKGIFVDLRGSYRNAITKLNYWSL